MSNVLCDKIVPPHVKGKIHKMIVQPAMLYRMDIVPMTSSHVKKLEVKEMKMCRWACGHTLINHARNDDIRDRIKVENIAERCRNQSINQSINQFYLDTAYLTNDSGVFTINKTNNNDKNKK